MLKCQDVVVHTDHQNLTYNSAEHTSDHVLCQRLLLEEYKVQLRYVKGKTNVAMDVISRLPYEEQRSKKDVE